MGVIESKIEKIHAVAQDAFRDHVLTNKPPEHGVLRYYVCGRPGGSSAYKFCVTTFPCGLCVTGDVGDLLVWHPNEFDILPWLREAVKDRRYLSKKVTSGNTREYDPDLLVESLHEWLANHEDDAELQAEIHELLEEDAGDEPRMITALCDTLGGYGDLPSMKNYSSNFLWCHEALCCLLRLI